jgi:hypothetical protein
MKNILCLKWDLLVQIILIIIELVVPDIKKKKNIHFDTNMKNNLRYYYLLLKNKITFYFKNFIKIITDFLMNIKIINELVKKTYIYYDYMLKKIDKILENIYNNKKYSFIIEKFFNILKFLDRLILKILKDLDKSIDNIYKLCRI